MVLKIVRFLWFLSVLIFLAVLLFTYAGLPEEVKIQDETAAGFTATKEGLFYGMLVLIALVNSLVFIIKSFYAKNEDYQTWVNAFIASMNIFFTLSIMYIGSLNSTEKFDYTMIGYTISGSLILLVAIGICGPLYLIYKRLSAKAQA